jgi:hypothetical protein
MDIRWVVGGTDLRLVLPVVATGSVGESSFKNSVAAAKT